MRDSVKIGLFAVGQKEPIITQMVGDDLFRKTGRYNYLERVFDHPNDWYHELIVDLDTGAIIKQCEEPPSAHREHGSAKRPRRSKAV